MSLKRIANSPKRGVGDTSLAKVEAYASEARLSFGDALALAEEAGVSGRALGGIRELLDVLVELRDTAERGVAATLEAMLERTGYVAELEAERSIEAQGRIENLQELVGVAAEFDGALDHNELVGAVASAVASAREVDTSEEPDVQQSEGSAAGGYLSGTARIQAFLESISLVTDIDMHDPDQRAVTLMTLHAAKGLEFPVVMMTGLEEGIFPHSRSFGRIDELEEERRLCYVGITRARERLYLCSAWSRTLFGATQYNSASRFLDEIPDELVRSLGKSQRATSGERTGEARRNAGHTVVAGAGAVEARPRPVARSGASGAESMGLRVGDDVVHAAFGEGVILRIEGDGDKAEAVVNFRESGERRLLLTLSPLRRP